MYPTMLIVSIIVGALLSLFFNVIGMLVVSIVVICIVYFVLMCKR